MEALSETKTETAKDAMTEIEVTNCPDCGTQWEVVITEHPRRRGPTDHREH